LRTWSRFRTVYGCPHLERLKVEGAGARSAEVTARNVGRGRGRWAVKYYVMGLGIFDRVWCLAETTCTGEKVQRRKEKNDYGDRFREIFELSRRESSKAVLRMFMTLMFTSRRWLIRPWSHGDSLAAAPAAFASPTHLRLPREMKTNAESAINSRSITTPRNVTARYQWMSCVMTSF
jgi:hypothetical protein